MFTSKKLTALFIFFFTLFFSCEEEGKTEKKNHFVFRENPDNVLWDYSLTVTRAGKKSYKLWSKRVEIYNIKKRFLCFDSLIVTFYDKENGEVSHWIHSRDGEWLQNTNNFKAMKNALVRNVDGSRLLTDTLYYEHSKDRIYSDTNVEFYTKSDTLYGDHFTSNSDLSHIKVFQSSGHSHRDR